MAKMPTSVINRRLRLDLNRIEGFIWEIMRRLIRIYNVCAVKDEMAWDLFYNIIFLDPVTTRHFSQFLLMWPHRRSRSSPFPEWWAAFCLYMGQMFDKTFDQMNNWKWGNRGACGDQVDRANSQPTSLGKVLLTGQRFSWYGSYNLRAKIESLSCRQYKPGDFLAVRVLNCGERIGEGDEDENWADHVALSGERSRPSDGHGNDDCDGEEDGQGAEKGTGKVKRPTDGKGKGNGKATEKGKGKGK
jgi:hypothetical protein